MKITLFFFLLLVAGYSLAPPAAGVNINPNLPGPNPSDNPAGLVANAYQFALFMGGVLAFGAIVYGAIRYTVSAGNPSGQAEGKEWVKGALWGLLLLAGATLILNTLNPSIAELRLPTLKPLEAPKAVPTKAAIPVKPNCGTFNCKLDVEQCGVVSGKQQCVPRSGGGAQNRCGNAVCEPGQECLPINNVPTCVRTARSNQCAVVKLGDCLFIINRPFPPGCKPEGSVTSGKCTAVPGGRADCYRKIQC